MLKDIVAAKALGDYRLHLRFVEGVLDLAPHLSFRGVFEPLRNPSYFAQVRVDPELGSVLWPNPHQARLVSFARGRATIKS
jgi:hypothetical protein